MNKTKIEWCDSTWNPVTGCLHECKYCYAMRIAKRFGGKMNVPHVLCEPILSNGRVQPYPSGFTPTFHKYRLDEPQKLKKPRTIFVCSMADLFGNWVPDEWIEAVFDACEKAPQHRYLFLTKNPKRYISLAEKKILPQSDNMWFGYTATRQNELWRFKHADDCPVRNLFVSIEPIQECIEAGFSSHCPADWVIIGAETGNRKNKVKAKREWIEKIMMECEYSNRTLLMKDSLIPIVGEENMRREFPWERSERQ